MPAQRMPKPLQNTLLATAICLAMTSCQTMNNLGDNYGRTAVGCVGGTLIGGLAGALKGGGDGALKGAAIGLAVGCLAGHVWDEREKAIRELAAAENMRIQMERVYQQPAAGPVKASQAAAATKKTADPATVGMVAQIEDDAMFNVNSATLTAAGHRQLEKLAAILQKARQAEGTANSPVMVIGHTDDTGSAQYNLQLSEQRAKAVVQILAKQGFAAEQLYYQGAGESRPVADNQHPAGRSMNRRVELVELTDDTMLQKRIAAEQYNPRYIQQSNAHLNQVPYQPNAATETRSQATGQKNATVTAKSTVARPTPTVSKPSATKAPAKTPATAASNLSEVDFGGQPAATQGWELAARFSPDYQSGMGLFSSAVASEAPIRSCANDNPSQVGEVKNLAGKSMAQFKTTEFRPGMNGKVWAAKVNGHTVFINPVAILADNHAVAVQPSVAFINQQSKNKTELTSKFQGQAQIYPGQDNMLMRIFISDSQAPIKCLDVLLPYGGNKAEAGTLYYPKQNQTYVAAYTPRNTGNN